MKTVQVLVAAINQKDYTLLDKMKIQSDVIVGNQCDYNSVEKFEYKGHQAVYLNFAERGVGLNRNNALMRATADYCLFADDDMIYEDNYADKVVKAFERCPKADVIIFNLREENSHRYIIKEMKRVNYLNYLRYGTARVAVNLKKIRENGIYFNQCFGGGTEHSHGEDNIFLTECLKHKLKIYTMPEYIAALSDSRESTWFKGYDDKYIKDQGYLYKAISRRWWKVLCLIDAIRRSKSYNKKITEAYSLMVKGKEK